MEQIKKKGKKKKQMKKAPKAATLDPSLWTRTQTQAVGGRRREGAVA